MNDLRKLGRNPLIKFVGISGSVAANNPTRDRSNLIDIDIFLITRNQCLWLYVIPLCCLNNFRSLMQDRRLCINFIMDESDLRIPNRNFFTATDIRNLIPVSGLDTFQSFRQANNWVDYYYPGFSGTSTPVPMATSAM